MCNSLYPPVLTIEIKSPKASDELSDEQLQQIIGGVPVQGTLLRTIELNPVNGRVFSRDLTPFIKANVAFN